jgi:AcrR family transcriptional regulator
MPRPRFDKLPLERREQIMEAAAREFAENGYEGASLNRILNQAGVSKGAAYYYFDDKADVFKTVAMYYQRLFLEHIVIDVETLTAETYWPAITQLYHNQFTNTVRYPWGLAAAKASSKLNKDVLSNPVLAETFDQMRSWLKALLKRGQILGVVRTDLPDELITSLVTHIDEASDQWVLEHWDEMDATQIRDMLNRVAEGMRRMLSP